MAGSSDSGRCGARHQRRGNAAGFRRLLSPAHGRATVRRAHAAGRWRVTILRFACCDERRRDAIAGHLALNAIDYIEVGDLHPEDLPDDECPEYDSLPQRQRARLLWQRRLTVHFVNPLTHDQQSALVSDKIRIAGGERIAGIRVDVLRVGRRSATLRSSRAGDYSRYWLALVRSSDDERVPPGFDPILSRIAFSY